MKLYILSLLNHSRKNSVPPATSQRCFSSTEGFLEKNHLIAASKYFWRCCKLSSAVSLMLVSLSWVDPTLAQASAQENPPRTLSVTGRGVENVQTTKAEVRLGVEAQGKTAQAVQQEVARRSAAVVALLKSRRVERLETTGISLNPTYDYQDNRPPQLTGFTASNIVSFRVATEQAGNLLDQAVQAGATRIDGLSFIAAEEATNRAQQQALQEAVQDAQAQANAVLAALSFTPRQVISIQVNGASVSPPPPRPLAAEADRASQLAAKTPIIGGEQEVEASVTLQISY